MTDKVGASALQGLSHPGLPGKRRRLEANYYFTSLYVSFISVLPAWPPKISNCLLSSS